MGLSVVKMASKSRSDSPCGCSVLGCSVIRSTTFTTRILRSGCQPAQQIHGGQRFERRDIAATGHHHVGLGALVVAGPIPDAESGGAVLDGSVHIQILQRGLLARHDHVDVVAAAQAMVGHREQAVGVGRQIHAHHVGLLVDHVIDEAGILMAEAVVILPPDVRGEQVIERRDGTPPRNVCALPSATWRAG